MKKILLIGANSYIGKSFENYIKNVNGTYIQIDKVSAANGQWKSVDLSLYDSIVMLSAIVHHKEHKYMKELYMEVNCKLPVQIAINAKNAGVKQFIFLSTAAVYGSQNEKITIESTPQPETLYGLSKFEAEKQLNALRSDNFKIAIIRSPKVYGEGCKGNFSKLEKFIMHVPIFPNFHNKQSMIHIENLCEHIKYLIDNISDGLFLPQDNTYMDIANFVVEMRAKKGKKTILIPGFTWMIRIAMKYSSTVKKVFGDFYYAENKEKNP
ncbi:MAG: UDP-glucose 4-epimerase [Lachnoclostridium sp.]|jgi:UDP-glucose 4-epimerase